jgi:FkbM family methyltransferase
VEHYRPTAHTRFDIKPHLILKAWAQEQPDHMPGIGRQTVKVEIASSVCMQFFEAIRPRLSAILSFEATRSRPRTERMFEKIRGHTIYAPGINSDSIVLDLGANRGEFSRRMRARFGGTYHLIEANPVLAEMLRTEGHFPVWHYAVANSEGLIRFNIARNDEGSSILTLPEESPYDSILSETVEVRARKLESLFQEIGTPRIDLLKIDIEGAEVQVLQGATSEILRGIGQITVEFHCHASFGFDLHSQVEEVIRRLRRHGFLCLDFSARSRGNVLFVNRDRYGITRFQSALWGFRLDPPPSVPGLWGRLPTSMRRVLRHLLDRALGEGTRADCPIGD